MSNNYYDNWERLVRTVLLKEKLKEIALCPSISSCSLSSASSSFRLSSTSPIIDSFLFSGNFQSSEPHSGEVHNSKDRDTTSKSGSLRFFLDEKTGKTCYMIGARRLQIFLAFSSEFWKWTAAQTGSRILDMAELQNVEFLDIRCKIRSCRLPRRNIYAAYLVYKLALTCKGLESVKAMIRFVDDESNEDAEKRARIVRLQTVEDRNRPIVVSCKEGWKEVELGNFYVGKEDDGEVEVQLVEKTVMLVKSGLIVGGILFRPTNSAIQLVSKQCRSKIVRA